MTSGVLIFSGMKVGVLPGDLQISVGDTGGIEPTLTLSTAYNVLPIWLRIAYDQLKQAKIASDAMRSDWGPDDEYNRQLLINELGPSLQVFVACAIALDALYDQLRPHANLDQDTLQAWRKNGTSRAAQVCEVIRRVYRLDAETGEKFRKHIGEILGFRDRAVHPSLELRRSCTRPDISIGVDWKFSAYRYTNARACFEATMTMLIHLYEKRSEIIDLNEQMNHIIDALEELKVVQRTPPIRPSSGDGPDG